MPDKTRQDKDRKGRGDLQEKIAALPEYPGLQKIWEIVPSARLVGGCVRDLLSGRAVKDIDLASPLPPEILQDRLHNAGIRTIPTGLAHGTITALFDGFSYEVTTLRRDVQTDGRHAVVAWSEDWREDAARRDFTINALSLSRDGVLHDYFGGVDDLDHGRLRFVGEAQKRIEEDALRILRFFRFYARYGIGHGRAAIDAQACQAIAQKTDLIKTLSVERIAAELLKILSGPALEETLALMAELGVLAQCLPRADRPGLSRLLAHGHLIEEQKDTGHSDLVSSGVILRLFVLCPDAGIGRQLKLSNNICRHLHALADGQPVLDRKETGLLCLRASYPWVVLRDRSWLAQMNQRIQPPIAGAAADKMGKGFDAEWDAWRRAVLALKQPVFGLTGRDLVSLGMVSGPDMGLWLKKTKEWWLKENCLPTREECLDWLKKEWNRHNAR